MASQGTQPMQQNPARAATERALVRGRGVFLGYLMRRLGNRAEAEDVLQEFNLRVLSRAGQLRDDARLEGWLFAILRSVLNDHFRRSGRRRKLGEAIAREAETRQSTAEAPDLPARFCKCVRDLVDGLNPADGELIRRLDMEESDRARVAADLGISRGALAVRLFRARRALRAALLRHCGHCCAREFDDCSCRSEQPCH